MTEKARQVFLDTTAWFGSKYQLAVAIKDDWRLMTSPIVVYEFFKIIQNEINLADQKKKKKRTKLLMNIKTRFPLLIRDLDVKILSLTMKKETITDAMALMEQFSIDIGDALNYQLVKQNNIHYILGKDKDWERLPKIELISNIPNSSLT